MGKCTTLSAAQSLYVREGRVKERVGAKRRNARAPRPTLRRHGAHEFPRPPYRSHLWLDQLSPPQLSQLLELHHDLGDCHCLRGWRHVEACEALSCQGAGLG